MSSLTDTTLAWLSAFGVDPLKAIAAGRALPGAVRDYRRFRHALGHRRDSLWPVRFSRPCLHDRRAASGTARGHYFHQDLWVARHIFERSPVRHVDVGSSVNGFVAHLAVFREVEVFDIRPQAAAVRNIIFRQADIMEGNPDYDAYCDSLSCLHALEHFGLGRYGDPVAPDGYVRGFNALSRMLRPGGHLYLSVPIGYPQRVEFNGHRVFAVQTILDLAAGVYDLIDFAWVGDDGVLHETEPPEQVPKDSGLRYGCGIFIFHKGE